MQNNDTMIFTLLEEDENPIDMRLNFEGEIINTGAVSEEAIEAAVDKYFEKNPVVVEEVDPTIYEWAKQPEKPKYTADEIEGAVDGKSAYEIAVDKGFQGTEEEWLNSLKGEQGPQGEQGLPGIPGNNGVTPLIGANGNWFIGEADTGKPSKGEKGDKGDSGVYIGSEKPTDQNVDVWIDLEGENIDLSNCVKYDDLEEALNDYYQKHPETDPTVPTWAKKKKVPTYGNPRSLSMLDYFGANKKIVFVGDSFTQGFGSTGCISYHKTDENGNDITIVGNSPEYGEANNLQDYEIGKKLWTYANKIWYEAIDGNGYAHRLINYLKNKFGCIAKNYGMSGATTGHLLDEKIGMTAENSDLVAGVQNVTVILFNTQDDWINGGIGMDGSLVTPSSAEIRTTDYIDLSKYSSVVVSSSGTSVKFKVVYYDENNNFVEYHGGGAGSWTNGPVTLNKENHAKALVKVGSNDITNYSKITITAETEVGTNKVRVIEGLTNGFDTVFLTIGGNDRGFKDLVNENGEITKTAEEQFEYNLNWLTYYLVNTVNKKVILMSMTPCLNDGEMRMSMAVIDEIIEKVANDYNVPFVSCYKGMLDYCEKTGTDFETLQADNIGHPNDEGYAIVEAIVCEQLGISEVNKNYIDNTIGNIEIALDTIITTQQELIGGAAE